MSSSRKLLALSLLLAGSVPQTGCIGSFALTDKVFQWNRGLGSIVVQEIVFLAFCIIPVYEITVFADAVVFNIIEFVTGSNPIAGADRPAREVAIAEGVSLSLSEHDGRITATLTGATAEPLVRQYVWGNTGASVYDASGALLVQAELGATGGVVVSDAKGNWLTDYSASEVGKIQADFVSGGSRALAQSARTSAAVAAE